jgi:hypothetical protein
MKLPNFLRRDRDALERAKQAAAHADKQLENAKRTAAWADHTLDVNNLTGRFYANLRHGGHL